MEGWFWYTFRVTAKKSAKKSDATEGPRLALYRAYRPQTFKDVEGQDQVITVLEAAVKSGDVAHAYLFAGTRGTGKTSIARILAHELGVHEHDIQEIDAASNRGIDDARAIREGAQAMPFSSPYKIYIIDEAHMLTKEAWNALLKVLEEPPAHVIFIFATTELHKVPDTIRSRCESYAFNQPSRELLAKVVARVAKKEGYTLEGGAADLIAALADGSFRDALGILQKVLTISGDDVVNVAEVERVTGAPSNQVLRTVVEAMHKGDGECAIGAAQTLLTHGGDVRVFMRLLMQRVRVVILARHAPHVAEKMKKEFVEEDFKAMMAMGADKDGKINSHTLRALLNAYETMQFAAVPIAPLELAFIDLYGEK